MKVFTVANHKGGVGKTSISLALAAGLAAKGFKVLAIDANPQEDMTISVKCEGIKEIDLADRMKMLLNRENIQSEGITLNDVFKGTPITEAIYKTNMGFDFVRGDFGLSGIDMRMADTIGRETYLRDEIASVADMYDYCIIDTPNYMGTLTINALTTSDAVIMPILIDDYGIKAIHQTRDFIKIIKKRVNPELEIGGVVINQYENNNFTNQIVGDLRAYGDKECLPIYNTMIHKSNVFSKAHRSKEDIFAWAHKYNKKVELDLNGFIDEFLEKSDIK